MLVKQIMTSKKEQFDRCGYCDGPAQSKCGRCEAEHYCSQTCQAADWPVHGFKCVPKSERTLDKEKEKEKEKETEKALGPAFCCICLQNMQTEFISSCCLQSSHFTCISVVRKKGGPCPTCRAPLGKETVLDVVHGLIDRKEWSAAEMYLRNSLQHGRSIELLFTLALILKTQKKFKECISIYRDILKQNPKSAEAHSCLGGIFLHENFDFAMAETHFREAVRLNHSGAMSTICLGIALSKKNKKKCKEEAEATLLKALKMACSLEEFYVLGCHLSLEENYESAEICFQEALKLDVTNSDSWFELGNILYNKKDSEGAEDCYRKAAAKLEYRSKFVEFLVFEQKYVEAEIIAKDLLTNHVKDFPKKEILKIRSMYGKCIFSNSKDLDRAMKPFELVLKHDPSHLETNYQVAKIQILKGLFKEAEATFRNALHYEQTKKLETIVSIGKLCLLRGERAEADTFFKKAKRINSEHYSVKAYFSGKDIPKCKCCGL